MYTCIIVDDQTESVNLIKNHVSHIPQLDLKLATTDAKEALRYLDTFKPDIVFLDIEMPDISGIGFIDIMRSRWGNDMPKVVFITGFKEYALKGYEYGVVDYITKPVTFDRFKISVDRIINDLEKIRKQEGEPDYFFADVDWKKVRINFDDIIFIQGAKNYVLVVTHEKKIITYKSMRGMMKILPEKGFIRTHKSYIVSIDKVQAQSGNNLIFRHRNEDINVPIGITYKYGVLKKLKIV